MDSGRRASRLRWYGVVRESRPGSLWANSPSDCDHLVRVDGVGGEDCNHAAFRRLEGAMPCQRVHVTGDCALARLAPLPASNRHGEPQIWRIDATTAANAKKISPEILRLRLRRVNVRATTSYRGAHSRSLPFSSPALPPGESAIQRSVDLALLSHQQKLASIRFLIVRADRSEDDDPGRVRRRHSIGSIPSSPAPSLLIRILPAAAASPTSTSTSLLLQTHSLHRQHL